ncbi:RAMP superfamily CRISPR-associated protein [Falsiroseomonas sp.]|uniref:RAMP superfamily CRISPR-associated protein n=1 Tax=Falsiroseomonas sp. TaxID=2870721 RepID=UPI003F6E723A
MITDRSILRLALVTVEAVSAVSIGAGTDDNTFDVALVRDANGLPALPGTTIAGVLRTLWRTHGVRVADETRLFGNAGGAAARPTAGGDTAEESPSRVEVGWGHIVDGGGQPVIGRLITDVPAHDPVLAYYLDEDRRQPAQRDRVRLTARGSAADTGHFDRRIVIAGTRFTFELALWSDGTDRHAEDREWQALIGLLHSPLFRVGGATRSGLGRLELLEWHEARYDLGTAAGRQAFAAGRPAAHLLRPSADMVRRLPGNEAMASPALLRQIDLEVADFLRIGDGAVSLAADTRRTPKMLQATEEQWVWPDGAPPHRERCLLIPASAIKGPLRHRTAFHHARRTGNWAAPDSEAALDFADRSPAVRALFGSIKDSRRSREAAGSDSTHAGRVLIDDILLHWPPRGAFAKVFAHNGLDRFTGGVRDGVLFDEEVVGGFPFRLTLHILPGADTQAMEALEDAIADLETGRLQLGAASSRGHGVLRRAGAQR